MPVTSVTGGSPWHREIPERLEAGSGTALERGLGRFFEADAGPFLCRHMEPGHEDALFSGFGRVLLQDSSVLPLPAFMARYYKGSRNGYDTASSQAKVQAIPDIKNRSYVKFDISSFTRNDQSAAGDILEILTAGDVVIRDPGYFVTGVLSRIHRVGAFFLSRYHHRSSVFDAKCVPLDILEVLTRNGQLDTWIRIGAVEKLAVRIVTLPVPARVANKRRRLMRKDTRYCPSARNLKLLGWMIFITNIPEETWDARQIGEIYGLRWRIEVVFKAWKGDFGITSYSHLASRHQIESIIYTRLIYALLFQITVYSPLLYLMKSRYKRKVSLIKLASFFTRYHWLISPVPQSIDKDFPIEILGYFCAYDKRKRLNYEDRLEMLGEQKNDNKLS